MTYTQSPSMNRSFQFLWLKSFLMWAFALTVCMVVIGFPILILVVTVSSLMAVTLQSVLPMSAVLVVTAAIVGIHLLGIALGSAILTFQGIHPQDVKWLTWLNGKAVATSQSVYASCPLTCEVNATL
ncbi:MAG: hypothetical protein HC771_09810 [Synechococcales cyanobacterium CRU_2_2]|nr:hypothetical protein [Synechococcales cyanobacterium CRU_2_2]